MLVFRNEQEASLLNEARTYVEYVLQTGLHVRGGIDISTLPAFLGARYSLIDAEILGRSCILTIQTGEHDDTPATLTKHHELLKRRYPDRLIILLSDRVSNHNRHRLIGHHVAFIVPGNQLFVPVLAMDLREHFRSEREQSPEALTPTAQLIILAFLLNKIESGTTASALASLFRYSAMSMGRAINEVDTLGLVSVAPHGRFREVRFEVSRFALWDRVRPLLRSPVRKRRRVREVTGIPEMLLAGETALAERTDLSHPRIETRAIAASAWKALAKRYGLDHPAGWQEAEIELKTWTYDPALLGEGNLVDPISLWLSLPETSDDRIGAARDALLGQVGL